MNDITYSCVHWRYELHLVVKKHHRTILTTTYFTRWNPSPKIHLCISQKSLSSSNLSYVKNLQTPSNSIIPHQLSHTLKRPRHPRFKYHFKRHWVGVGRFCECQFVDGGWRIRFYFECPLDKNGVYEDGSTKKKEKSNKIWNITGSRWVEQSNQKKLDWTYAVAICCPGYTLQEDLDQPVFGGAKK